MKRIIAAGILASIPAVTSAVPLSQYSKVLFFGDSFTDGGAGYDLAGEAGVPSAIYPKKQLTNGDVWATKLGGVYVDGTYQLKPGGLGTTNFAVGSAEAVAEPADISPDMGEQISVFQSYANAAANLGSNSLAFLLFGANDFRDIELPPGMTNAAGSPGVRSSSGRPGAPATARNQLLINAAEKIGDQIISATMDGVNRLLKSGVSKVGVFGLPDLGILPSVIEDDFGDVASEFTPLYNAKLETALEAMVNAPDFEFDPSQVQFIDGYSIFNEIIANAGSLGITKPLAEPCLKGSTEADVLACVASDPNSYFFYDSVHPTETVHEAFAAAVEQQLLMPVPLPASSAFLLVGIGGLFVLRRTSPLG